MSFGQQPSAAEQKIQFEMIFSLISSCFNDCVNDFKSMDLTQSEQTCLNNCASRNANTQDLIMQVQQEFQGQMGGGGGAF
mmetsp:Transcript_17626/g.20394  ORF Transcript_17626/g.20394 Transcript_17626/m.20394 type:complete len:80 (-) Transcript_17626:39-278(-)